MYTLIAYKENYSGDRDYRTNSYHSEFIYRNNLTEDELIEKLIEIYYKDFCREDYEGSTDDLIILKNGDEIHNSWFGATTDGILKIAEDAAFLKKEDEVRKKAQAEEQEKIDYLQKEKQRKEKRDREEFERLSKKFGGTTS
ncbi:MAG: hypothetical protein KQ78_00022 [Candidatus Izimaplasma bacterium HR2]|nr:MAG: hypothetical protein KQ78_00022 [Candidatus Izimaplasma bacterium HR2]